MPFTHPAFEGVAEAVRQDMYKFEFTQDVTPADRYSPKALEAAQRALEQWFYENIGIDMESTDYEELTKIMFNAAKEAELLQRKN